MVTGRPTSKSRRRQAGGTPASPRKSGCKPCYFPAGCRSCLSSHERSVHALCRGFGEAGIRLDRRIRMNRDGGVTDWFGPSAPVGHEKKRVQTMPGKGCNVALRLYGPLEPWFSKPGGRATSNCSPDSCLSQRSGSADRTPCTTDDRRLRDTVPAAGLPWT